MVKNLFDGCHSLRITSLTSDFHSYKPGSEPKRVLLAFKFSVDKCVIDDLTIELSRHVYSEEYIALTKEFYLNM